MKKRPIIYAFIDSQNLNLGTGNDIYKKNNKIYTGWKLDFKKFRRYLKDKFYASKAFLFIGYIPGNSALYNQLESYGYQLIFKQTVKDHNGKVKGNVDAELVLHSAAIELENYDEAVIVSGDGDFRCLYEFLLEKKKLSSIIIPNKHTESTLLKEFQPYKVFLYREKNKLEFKQKKREASLYDT